MVNEMIHLDGQTKTKSNYIHGSIMICSLIVFFLCFLSLCLLHFYMMKPDFNWSYLLHELTHLSPETVCKYRSHDPSQCIHTVFSSKGDNQCNFQKRALTGLYIFGFLITRHIVLRFLSQKGYVYVFVSLFYLFHKCMVYSVWSYGKILKKQ